jgi:hypothetical protein
MVLKYIDICECTVSVHIYIITFSEFQNGTIKTNSQYDDQPKSTNEFRCR